MTVTTYDYEARFNIRDRLKEAFSNFRLRGRERRFLWKTIKASIENGSRTVEEVMNDVTLEYGDSKARSKAGDGRDWPAFFAALMAFLEKFLPMILALMGAK